MSRFKDQVVVITGGAGGIGRAAAARFAREGADIVAIDRSGSDLAGTAETVEHEGRSCLTVEADVSVESDVAAYVAAAVSRFGRVDVLFNNAGIEGVHSPLIELPVESFDEVIAVNLRGVFLGLKHVARAMTDGGAIVNTASVAGLGATPNIIAYGASKHAVIGMTKSAALELAGRGIRVNAICPGPIETRMMRSLENQYAPGEPEKARAAMAARNPLGRYGEPEEVAGLVAFLSSSEAKYMTGGIYTVDGGMTA